MASPLSSFMKNLQMEHTAINCEIVSDNARIENPIESLDSSVSSLESINFSATSPVLGRRDGRKEIKKRARWSEDVAYTHPRKLPEGRLHRSASDDELQQVNRFRQRPPACPTRQRSNESVISLEEYKLPLIPNRRPSRVLS